MDPPDAKKPKVDNTAVICTIKRKNAGLGRVEKVIEDLGWNISHIESRPSQHNPSEELDLFVNCDCPEEKREELARWLKECASNIRVSAQQLRKDEVPWYPRHVRDLDRFANKVLEAGADLKADHPGFSDQVYRERRKFFEDIAKKYKHGQPIPKVKYTEEEIKTWHTVFCELTKLYPTHACKEHNRAFPLLVERCGYREDNIPQLQDISEFMKEFSGFQLRPVAGLLSPRDFLVGLAFRVFHSTQYIRHGSKPLYTPEPDVCHELLGHVPLLCDPDFAQFSQEIGMASLGAPDEYIERLSTLYWYTIEFGMCKQDGKPKAYGAGLLSSFGELEYCLTDKPEVRPLDPFTTSKQEYPITEYQPIYFLAESFQNAKEKLMEFASTIPKPFSLRYNPYTQSVEEISDKPTMQRFVSSIKDELDLMQTALTKIN